MNELKAIETLYDGYRFRSRLEARWAVFFSSIGLKYEYEKEGFDLGEAGWYLPDFWLPEMNCWIEIKGAEPAPSDLEKCVLLSMGRDWEVYLVSGLPRTLDRECSHSHAKGRYARGAQDSRILLNEEKEFHDDPVVEIMYQRNTPPRLIIKALEAMKQARFEYGECGVLTST